MVVSIIWVGRGWLRPPLMCWDHMFFSLSLALKIFLFPEITDPAIIRAYGGGAFTQQWYSGRVLPAWGAGLMGLVSPRRLLYLRGDGRVLSCLIAMIPAHPVSGTRRFSTSAAPPRPSSIH